MEDYPSETESEVNVEAIMQKVRERAKVRAKEIPPGRAMSPLTAPAASRPADGEDGLLQLLGKSLVTMARRLQDLQVRCASMDRGAHEQQAALKDLQAAFDHELEARRVLEKSAAELRSQFEAERLQNQSLRESLEQLRASLQAEAGSQQEREQSLRGDLDTLRTSLQSEAGVQHSREQSLREDLEALRTKLSAEEAKVLAAHHGADELRMRVLRAERVLKKLFPPGSRQNLASLEEVYVAGALEGESGGAANVALSFDYFLFEHRFRGSTEEIQQRQTQYRDLFLGRQHVVDIGCGRGEVVQLLRDAGVGVIGVDSNEDMIDFCRDRGLPIEQADLFRYLEGCASQSLDGVFAAQVVEHLRPADILRLLALCHDKLQPGGLMVAETMNINCPNVLANFYLDPTHIRPVPSELLRFLFEQSGFQIRHVAYSSPVEGSGRPPVFNAEGAMPPEAGAYRDYAVVAVRI